MSDDEDGDQEVPREEESSPAQRVFQNDLLVDMILHYALDDEDKSRQRKTMNSFKRILRLCLDRVIEALQKAPPDWYNIKFHYREGHDRLEKFTKVFANSPACRIPPVTLNCWFDAQMALTESIYSNLRNCLTDCGTGLQKLRLAVDARIGKLDLDPGLVQLDRVELYLPKLESVTLALHVCSNYFPICEKVHERAKLLVDSILAGAESLTEFSLLVYGEFPDQVILPDIFDNLQLTPTITTLNLKFKLRTGLLSKLLMNTQLPNLTDLKVVALQTAEFQDVVELEEVLEKFREQLKRLELEVTQERDSAGCSATIPPIIVLPEMPCLEELKWISVIKAWSMPASARLEKDFPVLKKICFDNQTYEVFRDLLRNIKICAVREAAFNLLPATSQFGNDQHDSTLVQVMEQMKEAFPNIVKLTLDVRFTIQLSPIKFIFEEMRQLQELEIRVGRCPDTLTLDEFVALFLGVSPAEAHTLPARREQWKILTQNLMPELKKLVLGLRLDGLPFWPSSLGWSLPQED